MQKQTSKRMGGKIGIFPRQQTGGVCFSLTVPVDSYEFAPSPFDVAIGTTNYPVSSFLRLSNRAVEVWQDVATSGYAADLAGESGDEYQVQQRAHKGYLQRLMQKGRLGTDHHPDSFETSFPITQGMSGAPLFVHEQAHEDVIGICVGSRRSQVVDFSHTEVKDGGATFSEKTVRIQEFGAANDIRGLLSWEPKIIGIALGAI
jgi:hypothetical protein